MACIHGKAPVCCGVWCVGGVYLLARGRFRPRYFLLSCAVAFLLLLMSALAIDHSIWGFVDRIARAVRLGQLWIRISSTLTSVLRWEPFPYREDLWSSLARRRSGRGYDLMSESTDRRVRSIGLTVTTATSLGAIWLFLQGHAILPYFRRYVGSLMLGITHWLSTRGDIDQKDFSITHERAALASLFVLLPYAYALG